VTALRDWSRRISLNLASSDGARLLFCLVNLPASITPLQTTPGLRRQYRGRLPSSGFAGYRTQGEAGRIVIKSYRDAEQVAALVGSFAATVPDGLVRIIVAGTTQEVRRTEWLRAIDGIELERVRRPGALRTTETVAIARPRRIRDIVLA